ncbi:hypothetical protein [Aquimarina agarilytica]|uniref:hypothetical protein n=1 Tax=Aquimarina agarilytica TaxID=1087449 RepID=UPI000287C331|nr:hypothetical protein [Aquimarina agarilytica]
MYNIHKIERKENFECWITSLPDQIQELKNNVPFETSNGLDESLKSLDIIENYIIEFLKSESGKNILNNLASYIAATINGLIPKLKWHIEVEDESDIYYCLPVLRKKITLLYAHIYCQLLH